MRGSRQVCAIKTRSKTKSERRADLKNINLIEVLRVATRLLTSKVKNHRGFPVWGRRQRPQACKCVFFKTLGGLGPLECVLCVYVLASTVAPVPAPRHVCMLVFPGLLRIVLRMLRKRLCLYCKKIAPGAGGGKGFLSSTQSPRANRLASNHIRPPAPASALRHPQCIGSPLAGGEYTS